jgi:type 1 glutamine amidotransferase
MFWAFDRSKGRVFGCVPGHYSFAFDDPLFRLLLLRGMAWAAHEHPYRFDELVLRSAAVDDG